MRATAAPEEGNKVRLSVEIDETEMDEALDEVMRRLSREVRVPGFRPGKVPRRVLEARMGGPAALRVEAIREALPDFYARAVTDAELDPIDQPEIDITSGDESGAVSFDAVVMVRPTVAIPGYGGLVVTLPGLDVPDDEITAQIDRLRATSGELAEVTRPARDGDQVTIDIHGTREGAEGAADDGDLDAEDLLYEVGSGGVVPDLDDQLRGAKVGDIFEFDSTIEALGHQVSFRVLVKDVKELVLPGLDDELATRGERLERDVDQVREQLDRAGRLAAVRSDRRKAKAMRWLIDNVDLVDEEGRPVSRDDLKVNQGEEDSE